MGKRWLPLESNPDVLNDFVQKLGFDTSKYAFCDVFGLDEVRLVTQHALIEPVLVKHTVLQQAGAAGNGATTCGGGASAISCHNGLRGCQR